MNISNHVSDIIICPDDLNKKKFNLNFSALVVV